MWLVIIVLLFAPLELNAQAQSARSLERSIDRYVAPLIALNVFSGTILIARHDSIVLEKTYGLASIEQRIPLRPSAEFRIASISKSFTRALLGRLADKGQLGLDDSLSRWLPDCALAKGMTLRMVLFHRAGVPSVNSIPYDEEAIEPNSLQKLVSAICKMSPDYPPGTRERYSNGGYALLARVAEIAGKEDFATLLNDEILAPLQLRNTFHEADGTIVDNIALGYMPNPEVRDAMVRAPFQEMSTKTGGGSLVSNARDLLRWARAVGRNPILKPETWRALFPGVDSLFEASGRCPGYNSFLLHDRRHDVTVVVLANNYAAGMTEDIASAAYALARGEKPKPLPITMPTAANVAIAQKAAGRYVLPNGAFGLPPGSTVELRAKGNDLVAYIGPTPVDVLIPQGAGRYLARALWSTVELNGPGAAPESILVRALYRDTSFTAPRQSARAP